MARHRLSSVTEILQRISRLKDEIGEVEAAVTTVILNQADRIQELENLANPYSDCGTAICNSFLEVEQYD